MEVLDRVRYAPMDTIEEEIETITVVPYVKAAEKKMDKPHTEENLYLNCGDNPSLGLVAPIGDTDKKITDKNDKFFSAGLSGIDLAKTSSISSAPKQVVLCNSVELLDPGDSLDKVAFIRTNDVLDTHRTTVETRLAAGIAITDSNHRTADQETAQTLVNARTLFDDLSTRRVGVVDCARCTDQKLVDDKPIRTISPGYNQSAVILELELKNENNTNETIMDKENSLYIKVQPHTSSAIPACVPMDVTTTLQTDPVADEHNIDYSIERQSAGGTSRLKTSLSDPVNMVEFMTLHRLIYNYPCFRKGPMETLITDTETVSTEDSLMLVEENISLSYSGFLALLLKPNARTDDKKHTISMKVQTPVSMERSTLDMKQDNQQVDELSLTT